MDKQELMREVYHKRESDLIGVSAVDSTED